MEYANRGRVVREVAGAAKDAYVVYIAPKISSTAGVVKEIVLFPYKKMVGPIFKYIKSKIEGKQPDLVVDGQSINFILPEKYTKLGFSRELGNLRGGESFNDVLRDHNDLLVAYESFPNRELYVDTDMNIYEVEDGGKTLLKIFGEGRFYKNSEFKEIPVLQVLNKGLQPVKDFLERRRELINRERSDFVPLSNIFPSSSQQEAKEQYDEYLYEVRLHPLLGEDTKKVHKIEKLDTNSYSNLLKRVKQQRDWEKETNMRDRLETDEMFLRVLSKKELAERVKELFEIYMKKGTFTLKNWILPKKEKSTYYNSSNPYKNVFLDQMNNDVKLIAGQAPSIKGIIGDRAKNLAIDAGIGAAVQAFPYLSAALVTSTLGLVTFLLQKAFKMRSVDRRVEYSEKLEKFLDTAIKTNQVLQAQYVGQIIIQQNSKEQLQVAFESVNKALNEIDRMNRERNTKQLEDASRRVFDNLIKDNPNDKLFVENQDVPFTEELIEVEVPRQKELIMPKRRKTIDYVKLKKELYDQYVVKRVDPFPIKAWLGKLKANKKFGPKYNVLKEIVGLIGSPPSVPEIPLPKTQLAPLYPALPAPEVPFVDDVLALPAPREVLALPAPAPEVPFVDDVLTLPAPREVLALPAPPPKKWEVVKATPEENLLFTKLYDRYILGGEPLFSLKADIIKKERQKQYDSEYNVLKAIYNIAIGKAVPPFTPPKLKRQNAIGDLDDYMLAFDMAAATSKDPLAYDPPSKRARMDWQNGTKVNWPKELLKTTANHVWGKRMFLFFNF